MSRLSEQPYDTDFSTEPSHDNRRRTIIIAAGAALAVAAAVVGARALGGEQDPSDQPTATAIAGNAPTPTQGNGEIPTHAAEPLTPNTPTTIPVIAPSQGDKPKASTTAAPKPSGLTSSAPSSTQTPTPTETHSAPAKSEVLTPDGAVIVPLRKDNPEARKGKTIEELVRMYEIPRELAKPDNGQASMNEVRRAFGVFVTRLAQMRNMSGNRDYDYLYNSWTNKDKWLAEMPKKALSIFPAALSGDLLNDPANGTTRDFYEEFSGIMKGDLEAYCASLQAIEDEKLGGYGQEWIKSGPYLVSEAYTISDDTPVIQGPGNYRVDVNLTDYNNVPEPNNSNYGNIVQLTPQTIDERAKGNAKVTAHYEIFFTAGTSIDGQGQVWYISFRQK